MKRTQVVPWVTSGVVHVAVLVTLAAIGVPIAPVELSIERGGVTLVAVMEAAPEAMEHGDWHVHVPAIAEDHEHETPEAVLFHRHLRESRPLKPTETEVTRQDATLEVEIRPIQPLDVVTRVMSPKTAVSPSRRPRIDNAPPPELRRHEYPLRRTFSTEAPPIKEAVEVSVMASTTADEAGAAVDNLPRKLPSNPAPAYPNNAYARRQEGRVLLEVRVDARGKVAAIHVSRSSGIQSLDRAALETVQGWRFLPARRGGEAIAFTVTVPVRFSIRTSR